MRVTATPPAGTYTAAQQVTLSSNDAAADIFYTTDGSTPTAESTMYTGPVSISSEGVTELRFIAITADNTSPVVTETYTMNTIAPTISADPAGGTFDATQSVTLTSDDSGASIYYTTDGSTPTANSTKYTGPVQVSRSLTLRARAIDAAGNAGLVGQWAFVIGLPTTSLTLATPAPATVDFGGTSSLSGVLTGGGSPVAGRTVTVQTRALNATAWGDVPGLSAVTTATGGYTIGGLKPTATADYRVVFAGDPSFQASASSAQRVFVRGVLTLDPLVAQVSRNRQLTYSGTSGSDPHRRKDHHHGLGTRPEDAHLERHRGRERLLDREHEGAREGGNLHRRRDLER